MKTISQLIGVGVRRLVRKLLGTRIDTVWHQDSPGVRVGVCRNNLTRIWRNAEFSEVGECHLPATVLPTAEMPVNSVFCFPNDQVEARRK